MLTKEQLALLLTEGVMPEKPSCEMFEEAEESFVPTRVIFDKHPSSLEDLTEFLLQNAGRKTSLFIMQHGNVEATEEGIFPFIALGGSLHKDPHYVRISNLAIALNHLGYKSLEVFSCCAGANLSKTSADSRQQNDLVKLSASQNFPITINSGHFKVSQKLHKEEMERDFFDIYSILPVKIARMKTAIAGFVARIIHAPETGSFVLNGDVFKKSAPKDHFTEEDLARHICKNIQRFLEFCEERGLIEKYDYKKIAHTLFKKELSKDPDLISSYRNKAIITEAFRGKTKYVKKHLAALGEESLYKSALFASCTLDNKEITEALLEAGINKRLVCDGETVLSVLCDAGYTEMVDLVLKAGADPELRPKKGIAPIEAARESGIIEVVNLLEVAILSKKTPKDDVEPKSLKPLIAKLGRAKL